LTSINFDGNGSVVVWITQAGRMAPGPRNAIGVAVVGYQDRGPATATDIVATLRAEGRKTRNGGDWLQPTVSKILTREEG
jgi:hypothetical protein